MKDPEIKALEEYWRARMQEEQRRLYVYIGGIVAVTVLAAWWIAG